MSVKLDIDVSKSVPGFDLEVTQSMEICGVTAIFGPSGAGKSTLLRLIAGFEMPDKGRISVNGQIWDGPAHKRSAGYMFQDGRLFEHLTVMGNLEFAHNRSEKAGVDYTIDDIIDAFELSELLDRDTRSLSGGERQRAALARTLLTRPKLLLLDEPLAGLDRARKRNILPFIENLPKRFGLPCLYVSHDIEEVSRLADDILVLEGGRAKAYGSALDILGRLDLEPLAGREDPSILLQGTIKVQDERLALTRVSVGQAALTLPLKQRLSPGDEIRLRVRAKDVALALTRPKSVSIRNVIECQIIKITPDLKTAFADVVLDIGGVQLRSRITRAATEDLKLAIGMTVFALIKTMSFEGRL